MTHGGHWTHGIMTHFLGKRRHSFGNCRLSAVMLQQHGPWAHWLGPRGLPFVLCTVTHLCTVLFAVIMKIIMVSHRGLMGVECSHYKRVQGAVCAVSWSAGKQQGRLLESHLFSVSVGASLQRHWDLFITFWAKAFGIRPRRLSPNAQKGSEFLDCVSHPFFP